MSLDTNQEVSPLNLLDLFNTSTLYSLGDLELIPSQSSLDSGSLHVDMYSGCCEGNNLNCLDQDWLTEPVSLCSPEEQDSDIKASSLSLVSPRSLPFTTYQYPSIPVESSTPSHLIPDPSLPFNPLSIHSYSSEEEIKDIIASFNDGRRDGTVTAMPFYENMIIPPQHITIGNGSTGDKSRKRKSRPITSSNKQSCTLTPATKCRLSKAETKVRRRKQNKKASLRYRRKKKEEKSDTEVRLAELEDKNRQLKAQVTSLSYKTNLLKDLWSEVCEKRKQQFISGSS